MKFIKKVMSYFKPKSDNNENSVNSKVIIPREVTPFDLRFN